MRFLFTLAICLIALCSFGQAVKPVSDTSVVAPGMTILAKGPRSAAYSGVIKWIFIRTISPTTGQYEYDSKLRGIPAGQRRNAIFYFDDGKAATGDTLNIISILKLQNTQ